MKKRSLSHFAYYAANRAFPVFLLLLLLLGFTACSAGKGAKSLLVQRAEDNNADLVIAAYNRIVPYKPKKEAKLDPLLPNKKKQLTERLAKFQTFGFLPMGFMTKEEFACGLMQEPASFYYGVMWNKLYRADLVRAHTDVRCKELYEQLGLYEENKLQIFKYLISSSEA